MIEDKACGVCNGTGKVISMPYPGQAIERKFEGFGVDKDLSASTPVLEYIPPPIDSLQEMRTESEYWETKSREAVNRMFVQDKQSGVAKEADREDERNFVKMVSDYTWTVTVPGLIAIYMRDTHGKSWMEFMPKVIPPTQFKLESSAEILAEIKEGEGVLPDAVQSESIDGYILKKWPNDKKKRRRMSLPFLIAPLAVYTPEDRNLLKQSLQATEEDVFNATHAYGVIREIEEDEGPAFESANDGLNILFRPLKWWKVEVNKRMDEMRPEPEETMTEFLGQEKKEPV